MTDSAQRNAKGLSVPHRFDIGFDASDNKTRLSLPNREHSLHERIKSTTFAIHRPYKDAVIHGSDGKDPAAALSHRISRKTLLSRISGTFN
jgi:hypothetical protein